MDESQTNGAAQAENVSEEVSFVNSPTTEQDSTVDSGEQTANNSQDGNPKVDYHKIPRFQEITRKNNELKRKIAELEAERSVPKQEQTQVKREGKYAKYNFEPFKEQYATMEEFYEALADRFNAMREFDSNEERQKTEAAQQQLDSEVTAIREELGDEFDNYKAYAKQYMEKYPNSKISLTDLMYAYLDKVAEQGGDAKAPPKVSKVNTSSRNAGGGKSKDVSGMTDREIDENILADLGFK